MYHGPDLQDTAECNAIPDDDPIALRQIERQRVRSAWGVVKAFGVLLFVYFAGNTLYQYVLGGIYMHPGIADCTHGNIRGSQRDLEAYLRWGGSESVGHYYLGMCYKSDGRYREANDQFERDTSGFLVRDQEVMHVNARSRKQILQIE